MELKEAICQYPDWNKDRYCKRCELNIYCKNLMEKIQKWAEEKCEECKILEEEAKDC